MSLILSNFARRVADYAKQNRARLIKALLILVAALFLGYLLYYGIEKWYAWRFEKRVEAIDKRIGEKDAEIKAAEAFINALKTEIAAKDALLEELEKQAVDANNALRDARGRVVTLKENYETIRYLPLPSTPVSCADACRDLAAVGYACR